jgi:hypothetical protein
MAAEIEEAGGTVEKFVGDAVMAAFGAPAAQEDRAERALHAALSMQGRLEEIFGESLSLRIGVNTGNVVGQPREGSSFRDGRRRERGSEAGAGRRARRDPGRRAHGECGSRDPCDAGDGCVARVRQLRDLRNDWRTA